jgi:hypothetical protein
VLDSNAGYLSALGWKIENLDGSDLDEKIERTRRSTLDALESAAQGRIPAQGPRGGARWTPRYFARRAAWHILDHAWEIEDRVL